MSHHLLTTLRALKADPRTESEWDALRGVPVVTYRGRRIEFPRGACTLVGGGLDQTQVPCVTELVLGTLLRDVLARQGATDAHARSITTAARIAPAYVDRIERSLTFSVDSNELEHALLGPH